VLRLAAAVSDGDVTLETATRFRSFARPERRVIMAALDSVVRHSPAKLADVAGHAEPWKRLGERLHPHEHGRFPHAQRVFAAARGEERFPSLTARSEQALREGAAAQAARRLATAPGLLFRSLDRLLREATAADRAVIMEVAAQAAESVSGRVLLSVREHFQNRGTGDAAGLPRVFANRKGRAWVTPEARSGIDQGTRRELLALLDEAVAARLPEGGRVIVDPAVLGVALPLSGKPAAPGLGVMPRGSVSPVVPGDQDVLSFFVHWRQKARRTDYDLSALMVTADFARSEFVSWQAYRSADAAVTYSGDITDAPDGATEFISCDLRRMSLPVVIPQVNIYAGEPFDEAAEAFFGFMLRGSAQRGAPFEAATVRMKSDLRGSGRVALPLAFLRGEDGRWRAKWLHFYLKGHPVMNVVQGSRLSTSLLTRTVIERDYLRVSYLAKLMAARTADITYTKAATPDELALAVRGAGLPSTGGPVTYIGLGRPEGLPDDAAVFTLANLASLIPG
jgi:stress response protein SCP2